MKICIWFRTIDGPWGGGNQFLKALGRYLTASGHMVTDSPRGEEAVVLVNAFNAGAGRPLRPSEVAYVRRAGTHAAWSRFVPVSLSSSLRRRGPAIVHRLDGVAEIVRGHRTAADDLQSGINRMSDFTIFQSGYCEESFASVGITPARSTIINNGVEGSIFYPGVARPQRKILRFIASSWSPNPRKGFATLAALSLVPDVEVRFAGRWPAGIETKNVVLLGARDSRALADELRDCDAMVHAAENEPCSNAILEALACGLPVLYLDSGGNRELAGDFGDPIGADLAETVEAFRSRYEQLRERVRESHGRFLIDAVAGRYLEAFEAAAGEIQH